ncbi:DUF2127 domain-containing protein [Actinoplanes sp. L3-i22]|uniref:DUF2127 domain-containing protein n=1 Tax=Actinoplanes sp. L3-i22 TaxID=2836373 RepID=UPI001C762FF5|nr:DUF2127 domain-containing protein [Actinoplanes sp. L3-i22]BCY11683.1 hypothetical protein L3i22_067710 [Actinoplanes sp. L3-i22]
MDLNLWVCGRRGHLTYAPAEEDLRARLHATTALGVAWRCLRCGDFVLGEPRMSGPAADAPLVPRGRALRDAIILRLLAVERFVKGVFVLAAGYGVIQFRGRRDAIERAFHEDVPLLKPFTDKIGWNLENSAVVETIRRVVEAQASTLLWAGIALLVYGALQLTEGAGLWLLKRWGEYFALIATSLGLPIEIYELTERLTWFRVAALVINVAAVLYLLISKRLFGIRGGHRAYEAERHEMSLMEVEHSATGQPAKHDPSPARAAG